jgi:hypothetical protein
VPLLCSDYRWQPCHTDVLPRAAVGRDLVLQP